MRTMTRRWFAALALTAGVLQAQSVLNETVSVGYVMIPFTAIGTKGRPLTDLRLGEVRLFVDGARVRSDMFEKAQNAPVSFTILLDGSGSMGLAGKMDSARAAIGALGGAPIVLADAAALFGGRVTADFLRTFDASIADAMLAMACISRAADRHIHVTALRRAIAEAAA